MLRRASADRRVRRHGVPRLRRERRSANGDGRAPRGGREGRAPTGRSRRRRTHRRRRARLGPGRQLRPPRRHRPRRVGAPGQSHVRTRSGRRARRCGPSRTDFSARFTAKWRHYRYDIWNAPEPNPFLASTSWHVFSPLSLPTLRLACDPLIGEHDFSSFCRRPKARCRARPSRR